MRVPLDERPRGHRDRAADRRQGRCGMETRGIDRRSLGGCRRVVGPIVGSGTAGRAAGPPAPLRARDRRLAGARAPGRRGRAPGPRRAAFHAGADRDPGAAPARYPAGHRAWRRRAAGGPGAAHPPRRPGAAIPEIALRRGYTTAVSFADSTGAPWPIEEALVDRRFLPPGSDGARQEEGSASRHLLYLTPSAAWLSGTRW